MAITLCWPPLKNHSPISFLWVDFRQNRWFVIKRTRNQSSHANWNYPKRFYGSSKRQRNMSWRSDKPATLVYAEALDWRSCNKVDFRDEVFFGTHRLMPQQLHW
jgi:hypothetical protein